MKNSTNLKSQEGFSCAALIMGCFLFTLPVHGPDHFYSPNHPLPQAE